MKNTQSGNILVYVLMGVALFAALSFVLSRQMADKNGATSGMDDNKAQFMATQLINHASQMKNVLGQMGVLGGNTISDFDFTLPSAGTFNDAPTSKKVFHPAGGGMPAFTSTEPALFDPDQTRDAGWNVVTTRSVEWAETRNASGSLISPTTDVLYNFVDVNPSICAAINYRLAGTTDIPELVGETVDDVFLSTATVDLNATNCPDCNKRQSLCVKDSGPVYVFYNIVAQR